MSTRGRNAMAMIARTSAASIVLLLSVATASADAQSPADTLAGRRVTCVDFRSRDLLEVRAQRITHDGFVDSAWTPNANALCVGTASEVSSVRVPDGSGGVVVAWVDTGVEEGDVYAQRLTSGGGVAPGWPAGGVALCKAPGAQYQLCAVSDGAGGAIVAWMDFRSESSAQVFAQRVTGDGVVAWQTDGVSVAVDSCNQVSPCALGDGVGGALIAWVAIRGESSELSLMRLKAYIWDWPGVALEKGLERILPKTRPTR